MADKILTDPLGSDNNSDSPQDPPQFYGLAPAQYRHYLEHFWLPFLRRQVAEAQRVLDGLGGASHG